MSLHIFLLGGKYTVSKLSPNSPIPGWIQYGTFLSIVKTSDELSIVCEESMVPDDVLSEGNWRVLKILGPLDFSLVGILAGLATTLANVGVSIFAISTYDTDYILIKQNQLEVALKSLDQAGYTIQKS